MSKTIRNNNNSSSNIAALKILDSLDQNFSHESIFRDGVSNEVEFRMEAPIVLSEITDIFDPSCINGAVANQKFLAPPLYEQLLLSTIERINVAHFSEQFAMLYSSLSLQCVSNILKCFRLVGAVNCIKICQVSLGH